jgi:hypothetical protein
MISFTNLKRSLASDERGNVAIVFGLFAVPAFLLVGLAIDVARAYSVKSDMQSALDAAVLGARNAAADEQMALATALFEANIAGRHARASVVFTPTSNGEFGGRAAASVPTPFGGLANIHSIEVTATAAAKPDSITTTGTPGGIPCIHVMSQSDQDAFYLNSNSNLDGSRCEVHVRSNRSRAMYAISSSNVSFKKVLVKGYATEESGRIRIVDAPNTITENADVVGNPYIDAIREVKQEITLGTCSSTNTGKTYTGGTVNPGTYCGATTFNGVRFNPGLYLIQSDNGNKTGALTLKGKLDGSAGVTFYFADPKSKLAAYQASEDSVLAAPTSGTTRGILMFEDSNRGTGWDFTIRSVNKQSWTGLVYFPSLNLTLDSLSEWKKANIALAVNRLKLISLSTVVLPYEWTPFFASEPVRLPGDEVTTTTEGSLVR